MNCPKTISTAKQTLSSLYAHSHKGRPIDDWHRLDLHLVQVAKIASNFAASFNSAEWAFNAGLFHDIGKAAIEFQKYLYHENGFDDEGYDGRINHSSAGTSLPDRLYGLLGRPLSYIVAGHHAGLADFYEGNGSLLKRLEEGHQHLKNIEFAFEELKLQLHPIEKPPSYVNKNNFHFWVRMLFSCLVDADFLDTENFMSPEKSRERYEGTCFTTLKASMDRYMNGISCENIKVKNARADVLSACREAAKLEPKVFTLTVPTGGGKTLASTTFALDHAVQHNKKRIIYVIPYTSIIEQTSSVLAKIFGKENVIEHHSNLSPDKETLRNQLSSENWDAPIVVTTNVQFFESLFASRPGRCRKLHNIVNSVVILDEAQMLPPEYLSPCVEALNELNTNYGTTIVLSTATQPRLPGLKPSHEIIKNLDLYKRLKRTEIKFPNNLNAKTNWKDLAKQLCKHDQVLCIVNSRKDCYDLFREMPDDTIHLSASMCGEHRSMVIKLIKSKLKAGAPLRVVSTQLVEAGVDIDFPHVYRALTGLDSIVQAAGRCNREGKLSVGIVNVFVPPRAIRHGLLHKAECATRELYNYDGFCPDDPDWHKKYFELLYRSLNDTGEDLIKELTPSDPRKLDVAFRSVSKKFQLIDDQAQQAVIVQFNDSPRWIEQLRSEGPKRQIMRRLQRYSVNVPQKVAKDMHDDGRLEILETGIVIQTFLNDYKKDVGLDIFNQLMPVEELIF